MKIKIEIKDRWTGEVLFEYEKENNTTKDTLVEAVKNRADLGGAYLGGAYLRGADLGGAKNIPFLPLSCPSDGAFIGWKKVSGYLVKLEIPEDARRCPAAGTKCRCDKALVVEIRRISDGKQTDAITNTSYYPNITYKVGEEVFPDSFDEDRWNECSHGIHHVKEVSLYNRGDKVQVGFSIYAREWNGKWYNNVDLVNITDESGAKPAPAAPQQAQIKINKQESLNPEDHEEDLPF